MRYIKTKLTDVVISLPSAKIRMEEERGVNLSNCLFLSFSLPYDQHAKSMSPKWIRWGEKAL